MSIILTLFSLCIYQCISQFDFGNTQGDYMVLQQAPQRAQIWGISSTYNDSVTVTLTNTDTNIIIETVNIFSNKKENDQNIWIAQFEPVPTSFSNYSITAKSSSLNKEIALNKILFGDIYICSGQSNMVKAVNYVINASEEIQAANNYPFIRVMTVNPITSDTPQISLLSIELKWSIANNISVGGGPHLDANFFSAVCWFYGRDLYESLNYPIGLYETAYGGTSIYSWSSPSVLKKCNISLDSTPPSLFLENTDTAPSNSQLWNAMIYPFLTTTIKGAIWYQGETDAYPPECYSYSCLLMEMINDWRLQWSLRSDTDALFPFGIVQISVWNDDMNVTCGDNDGYIPNPSMLNTFFATAIDLGDPNGPSGDIHPRFKQQVGKRLADAALNIIYGDSSIYFFGPIAESAMQSNGTNGNNVIITFRNVGEEGVEIRNYVGFEILDQDNHWIVANQSIVVNGNYEIIVEAPSNIQKITKIRYNWYKAPCNPETGIYECAIYDKRYQLPAIPFLLDVK